MRTARTTCPRANDDTAIACNEYLGELPEALSAWVENEKAALKRERALCDGGGYRFDPLLLSRVQLSSWGTGPVPQRLLYYYEPDSTGPIVVADRVERLEVLLAAGSVPVNGSRLQLKGRLSGWVLRALCEAVCETSYTPFANSGRPQRWAQALAGYYFGHIRLTDDALKAYLEHSEVDALSAGADKKSPDITKALDRVRNALDGEPARLAKPDDEKEKQLLQAIARAIAGGLLQRRGAESRQIKKMLLGVTSEYQIEAICAAR